MQVVYLKIVHRPAFEVNYFTVRVADWVSRLFGPVMMLKSPGSRTSFALRGLELPVKMRHYSLVSFIFVL